MHLVPQHFQAQRRYQEDLATRTLELLFPFAHGLAAISLDADAVNNGTLALIHARGVLPDGSAFDTPDGDSAPQPITLAERFSPTRDAHDIHLALPRWRPDAANIGEVTSALPASGSPVSRFRAEEEVLTDEATGADPLPVRFAARNLHFLFDDQVSDNVVSMPIARIRRDGRGQFQLDPDFIPPTLQLAASLRLMELLRRTIALLEAKSSALAATLTNAPTGAAGGAAAYVGNELATRWLLHAVRSAEAPLRHLLLTRRAHPEKLYLELSRLAGALCTFSLNATPRQLPLYDHERLTECFDVLEQHLNTHLDVVISTRAIIVPLQQTTDVLHVAVINDARCFEPEARWFLAIRADVSAHELIDRVQRLTKTCASKFVMELVRRAFDGFHTEHVPSPPAGLAPKADLMYFELTRSGPCAVSLAESKEVGVYVPDALPGAFLEIAVLVK